MFKLRKDANFSISLVQKRKYIHRGEGISCNHWSYSSFSNKNLLTDSVCKCINITVVLFGLRWNFCFFNCKRESTRLKNTHRSCDQLWNFTVSSPTLKTQIPLNPVYCFNSLDISQVILYLQFSTIVLNNSYFLNFWTCKRITGHDSEFQNLIA